MAAPKQPLYTFTPPPPAYTAEPLPHEQRLARASFSGLRPVLAGSFVRTSGPITLSLSQQDSNAQFPVYAQSALVTGSVALEEPATISEVMLRLVGRLDLKIPDAGSSVETLCDSYTLWATHRSSTPCPQMIPFSFIFPSTFKDVGGTHFLPPTYEVPLEGPHSLLVRSHYTLQVFVSKTPHRFFKEMWSNLKTLSVRLEYCPQTVPSRPILPDHDLFSSLKTAPEEWLQILRQVEERPVYCNLFIPSVQTYGLLDMIPFHIRISCPASALREMFPMQMNGSREAGIRVFLLRQVTVEVRGMTSVNHANVGEGRLWPLPPRQLEVQSTHPDFVADLDWRGELRCCEGITTGEFDAGKLSVKDFIVYSLTPSTSSQFPGFEFRHPVRLVTNSWRDDTGPVDRI